MSKGTEAAAAMVGNARAALDSAERSILSGDRETARKRLDEAATACWKIGSVLDDETLDAIDRVFVDK